jgi:hypothetical protein
MRGTLRRILGGVIVVVGLFGLGGGLYAAVALQQGARELERDVVSGMDFGLEGLEVVSDTLQVLIQTVDATALMVDAAVASSENTQATLEALQPAVQELGDMAGTDLPASIQAVQGAMPALEQAGLTIDRALRTLAGFEWSATIPLLNYELGFGLGVEYDPDIPLDQSIAQVGAGLAELPTQLEGIEADLVSTYQSLGETATSIGEVGEDLAAVGQDLRDTSETMEAYNDLIDRTARELHERRWNIRDQLTRGRVILTVILVWLALSQLAPLYLGCSLLTPWQELPQLEPPEGKPEPTEAKEPTADPIA